MKITAPTVFVHIQKRFSGHSRWSTIKRDKGLNDLARAKLFTKLCRQITASVRTSGFLIPKFDSDPSSNLALSAALSQARQAQLPKLRIEAAIKNASGNKDADNLTYGLYEVMCPGGIALLVECLTNNKNRLVSELKHQLAKRNAILPANVVYLFERKGRIVVSLGESGMSTDEMMDSIVQQDGVEDFEIVNESDKQGCLQVICSSKDTMKLDKQFRSKLFSIHTVELVYEAKDRVNPEHCHGETFSGILEFLEEHEDVIKVHHNCEE